MLREIEMAETYVLSAGQLQLTGGKTKTWVLTSRPSIGIAMAMAMTREKKSLACSLVMTTDTLNRSIILPVSVRDGGGQPTSFLLLPLPFPPLLFLTNLYLRSHRHRSWSPSLLRADLDNESILDDEEEWHAEEGDEEDDADSLVDDDGAEMVIERPFGEPQAALLDLNCSETPLEATTSVTPHGGETDELEPLSLKNILPPGSRRTRTHPAAHQA